MNIVKGKIKIRVINVWEIALCIIILIKVSCILPAPECQAFTVTGGSVTFSGLGPGSMAVVTCDPGLYADNGDQQMTVTCRSTRKWSFPNPGCSGWSNVLKILCLFLIYPYFHNICLSKIKIRKTLELLWIVYLHFLSGSRNKTTWTTCKPHSWYNAEWSRNSGWIPCPESVRLRRKVSFSSGMPGRKLRVSS